MKLSTMENGLDKVRLDGEGLDKVEREGEGLDEVHHKEGMVLNRVAEKSNPSNLDCIQIEISASNLMTKCTQFLSQNGYCHTFLYNI